MGVADHKVADRKSHCVSRKKRGFGIIGKEPREFQHRLNDAHYCGLSNKTKSNRSESDSDLTHGQVFVKMILHVLGSD